MNHNKNCLENLLFSENKSEAECPLAEIISSKDEVINYKIVFYREPFFYSSKGTS